MSRNAKLLDYLLLLTLGMLWGSSFLFIKTIIVFIPPITLAMVRLGIAALMLFPVMLFMSGFPAFKPREWGFILVSSLLGLVIPFSLIGWGELSVNSNIAALLMGITPLATPIIAHFVTHDEKLTRQRLFGATLGFTGLFILFGGKIVTDSRHEIIGGLAITLAALCYALNTILTRKLTHLPKVSIGFSTLFIGFLLSLPVALVSEQVDFFVLEPAIWFRLVILSIFHTGLAALVLLLLIQRNGASFTSQTNFLVPSFGLIYGWIFLNEQLSATSFAAFALIICGLAIAQRR